MKIGLLGLPRSGKTTVFKALTGMESPVWGYGNGKSEPNVAVVKVPDKRVERLSELYVPRKTVYANVEFVDFAGLSGEPAKEGAFSTTAMGMVKTMDALTLVVRNFEDDLSDAPDPVGDLTRVSDELILLDLVVADGRLERIRNGYRRGQRAENLVREEKCLERIVEHLNRSRPVRDLVLSGEEEKMIRGFQFLTKKPVMVVLNSDEARFGNQGPLMTEIEKGLRVVEFAGKFEMELGLLDEEAAGLFMDDMGITESAYHRLTNLAYETLGYISFFTVGDDEVRAWNLRRGETALDAAATIHSDLARGFIRAECFSYGSFLECGSERGVREKGLFRLEGRDYEVQDGDILSIRFNV
ncbi:MAG: redox-regulated ATPase YchF [Deltaproteobacteria bacterium]|nr:redox-regulated ATPase YchF [Deltaproteobacteria bacterium]